MNGFISQVEKAMTCSPGEPRCLPCNNPQATSTECIDVMGYHDAREIPNYWSYAQNFALEDNMSESVKSWSAPSHVSLVSVWSAKCPEGDGNPMDCVSSLALGNAPRTWTDITYLLHKPHVSWGWSLDHSAGAGVPISAQDRASV